MFDRFNPLPSDPILGLSQAFQADPRSEKIDLGVGIYKLADGSTPIMKAVREAGQHLFRDETTKKYTPADGYPGFVDGVARQLFGSDHPALNAGRIAGVQAPGGCGALRLVAELLAKGGAKTITVGAPTWANHVPLMAAAGLTVETIAYYDRAISALDFSGFKDQLTALRAGTPVLLHGACHNPTGADFTRLQWEEIAALMEDRALFPVVDTAYHGFAQGLEEDAWAIRMLAERLPELLVTYSCSKNFGLYRERTGAVFIVGKAASNAEAVKSHLINLARGMYSMPPAHGGGLVSTILHSDELTKLWQDELDHMGEDVRNKRKMLREAGRQAGLDNQLGFVADQHGMFSLLPLSPEQVLILRDDYGIYMTNDGRINICGLTQANVQAFCVAYKSVQ